MWWLPPRQGLILSGLFAFVLWTLVAIFVVVIEPGTLSLRNLVLAVLVVPALIATAAASIFLVRVTAGR